MSLCSCRHLRASQHRSVAQPLAFTAPSSHETSLPPAEPPMAPPRDTAGTHQPQQADVTGRYNQKSTTFRNGTTEEGWFYPTPAALKAAADVRGARAAREFFPTAAPRSLRAQATPRRITPTSSSTVTTRTAWCTGSEARAPSPLNLCLRSPEVARALARGLRRALRVPGNIRGSRVGMLAACNTLGIQTS